VQLHFDCRIHRPQSPGQWVAQEQNGVYGGVFVSCAQAIKYVRVENGQHLETIIELPCEIELDMAGSRTSPGGASLGRSPFKGGRRCSSFML